MDPLLRWPTLVPAKLRKALSTKGIVVGVLCAMMVSVLTGITLADQVVYIKDGDATTTVYTTSKDVEHILESQNIEIGAEDSVEYTPLNGRSGQIVVKRAFDVTVTADNETQSVLMSDGTVADALKLANVQVSETDRVNVALGEQVHEDCDIVVDRVHTKVVTKKEKIGFKTVKRKTSSLYVGEKKVSVTGKKGVVVKKSVKTLVNGELESTKLISKKTVKKARKQVVLVGTKKRPRAIKQIKSAGTLKINGKTVQYKKAYVGRATAYSGGGTTASGKRARVGLVAVNPKVIPYGTKLYIRTASGSYTYGYAVAADTGGALQRGDALVDLYMNSTSACYNFGCRDVEVYVLK